MTDQPSTIHLAIKKYLLAFFSFVAIIVIGTGCSSAKLYQLNNRNRIKPGTLADTTYLAIQQFLQPYHNQPLKDTIIIKYDYNHESCWNMLDQTDDAQIRSIIVSKNNWLDKMVTTRQNVSIFTFREPGNNLNKIIKWNNAIRIDSTKRLYNLLFKNRSTCGTSIMILPTKQYIYVHSDSHSEVFELKQKQIETLLSKLR